MRVRSEADIKLFVNKEDIIVIKSDKSKRYGYARLSNTLGRCFDFSLALILIILASPFFLVIAIIIKLNDGGSVFFKQSRMGHHKKLFTIYKFRTLIPDADKIVGAEVLDIKHNVSTPLGNFLRNTRLDELPQLINILKGDMAFIGPRPQRPEIVAHFGTHIRDYDKRFTVKPGLIGFPQLFLPHNAPKKIQSSIDNMYLKIQQDYFWEIFLLFFTIITFLKNLLSSAPTGYGTASKSYGLTLMKNAYSRGRHPKKGLTFPFRKKTGGEAKGTKMI
jgi:lipopolysaccharide/colanic/teichoic acid biosynthesis glycosyltransferase